jgi:hypothetical protein
MGAIFNGLQEHENEHSIAFVIFAFLPLGNRDSVVGIATDYWLDD